MGPTALTKTSLLEAETLKGQKTSNKTGGGWSGAGVGVGMLRGGGDSTIMIQDLKVSKNGSSEMY